MRGTPRTRTGAGRVVGFIPACAGNTRGKNWRVTTFAVHPRLCGEHPINPLVLVCFYGSSPPVRGTPPSVLNEFAGARFIPACAGNTGAAGRALRQAPVHPRLCGEHRRIRKGGITDAGSSPPVRGTRDVVGIGRAAKRFIPACAGNTCAVPRRGRLYTVHPRLCGEHFPMSIFSLSSLGSSPPVRGTPRIQTRTRKKRRFIPACAGNTRHHGSRASYRPVHPRLCGEHKQMNAEVCEHGGSSPPVRGTLTKTRRTLRKSRFIPACAGNTEYGLP